MIHDRAATVKIDAESAEVNGSNGAQRPTRPAPCSKRAV